MTSAATSYEGWALLANLTFQMPNLLDKCSFGVTMREMDGIQRSPQTLGGRWVVPATGRDFMVG
jgi:hypothetical protein